MSLMKPTNLKEQGCSPTSSNCVIWQGDDIDCLRLCKGDTVSDVVFQLGCLLCDIKDQLDVDTYDLSCLNIAACDVPHTFREFIQFVIAKICEFQNAINGETQTIIAEQTMIVAACFQSTGLTMTLTDYVTAIGQKLCQQDITIQNQQVAIQQLLARIEVLEGN